MDYVGQCLWDIDTVVRRMVSLENDMPQYIVMSHPELKPKEMSAQEIKEYILERLSSDGNAGNA